MKYLLDTHVWIWWNSNPDALSQKVINLIGDPKNYEALLLATISLWEFCKLLERGRIGITSSPEEWMQEALDIQGLRLVPITPKIAYRSTSLPENLSKGPDVPQDPDVFQDPDVLKDPADQIITATAQEEDATVITKDRKITRYRYVRTFW